MAYFKNIHSLAELKKEYRRLALENHPDKGGSTEVMQQINVEFERLHEIWKNDTTVSANASGYENDYAGASAKEYADFVYNEYRWKGRNYQGQHAPEIVELVRNWIKETYPKYKFSVSRHHYNSIHIYLVKADFEAFKKDKGVVFHHDVNHYNYELKGEYLIINHSPILRPLDLGFCRICCFRDGLSSEESLCFFFIPLKSSSA